MPQVLSKRQAQLQERKVSRVRLDGDDAAGRSDTGRRVQRVKADVGADVDDRHGRSEVTTVEGDDVRLVGPSPQDLPADVQVLAIQRDGEQAVQRRRQEGEPSLSYCGGRQAPQEELPGGLPEPEQAESLLHAASLVTLQPLAGNDPTDEVDEQCP